MKNCWVVKGGAENWKQAFLSRGIWGLEEKVLDKVYWLALAAGDLVLFYVTGKVKGLVGYGKVRTKFYQNTPLWPAEIERNHAIWPLRFEFDVEFVLPEEQWIEGRVPLQGGGQFRQPLIPKGIEEATEQLTALNPELSVDALLETSVATSPEPSEPISPTHSELQKFLLEIGRLQNYVANSEFPMKAERLDVVWRRLPESVPTYAFEVQIGGDVYHALGKLKHAYDLWNSRIFLVATPPDLTRAKQLLAGTFHEIQPVLHLIEDSQVLNLCKSKRNIREIEKEMGIIP